jgi:ubiquinone/menaquinone biosynthesis C-methylase UbiE
MNPLFDHFGILAPFYERFIQPSIPQKLLELVNLPPDGLVLDAGGGTGRVSQFLRDQTVHIAVADISFKMLIEAGKKDGLQPVCSYTENFPFANNCFDGIIMVDALHHVEDQVTTIGELWRILKPGGRIVIEEPNILFFSVKLIAFAEKLAFMRSHFFAPQKIVNLFHFPGARVQIETDGATAWILVEKENMN